MSNHPNADWDGIMKAQAREPKPPRVTWINRDADVAQLRARIAELEAALAAFAAIKTSGPGALGYACEQDIACARAVLGGGDGAVLSPFEQQVAEALQEAMPITEGPALHHRRPLAEILAPRVAAAIEAAISAGMWCSATHGHAPLAPQYRDAALRALRGGGDGAP